MKLLRLQCSSLLLAGLLLAGPLAGQTTQPGAEATESQADQKIESESLRAPGAKAKPVLLPASGSSAYTSNVSDLIRIVVAMAIVIAIILVLRVGVLRMASLPGTGKSGKLVTVLSRSMISPRQQILVLQVGKRLLVVGDSGGNMSQLCELTDPDEIAGLIGQTRQISDSPDRRLGAFGSLFRRANAPFTEPIGEDESDEEAAHNDPPPEPVSVEEVGGLLDKIRLLQQQYKVKS